jgi:hypothetical protein
MNSVYQNILDGKYRNKIEYSKDPELRQQFFKECALLEELFRQDLAEEFGVETNPKTDLLFQIAYESGHPYGYNEIYLIYAEMVRLIL